MPTEHNTLKFTAGVSMTGDSPGDLTDADIPGFLGDLHLHIPAEVFGTLPAVVAAHRLELGHGMEALVERRDAGRRHGGGGGVGLGASAAGRGRHGGLTGFGFILLRVRGAASHEREGEVSVEPSSLSPVLVWTRET